ncbi:MAG: hypothetical protein SGCHY_005526 [Lobulomycetales sp.]
MLIAAVLFGGGFRGANTDHQDVFLLPGGERMLQLAYTGAMQVELEANPDLATVEISMYQETRPELHPEPEPPYSQLISPLFTESDSDHGSPFSQNVAVFRRILTEGSTLELELKAPLGDSDTEVYLLEGRDSLLAWQAKDLPLGSAPHDSLLTLRGSKRETFKAPRHQEYFIIAKGSSATQSSQHIHHHQLSIKSSHVRTFQRPDNGRRVPGLVQICEAHLGPCQFNLISAPSYILVSTSQRTQNFTQIRADAFLPPSTDSALKSTVARLSDQMLELRFKVGGLGHQSHDGGGGGGSSRSRKRRSYLMFITLVFIAILSTLLTAFFYRRRGAAAGGYSDTGSLDDGGASIGHSLTTLQLRTFADHRNQLLALIGVDALARADVNEWDGEPLPPYEPPKDPVDDLRSPPPSISALPPPPPLDEETEVLVHQYRE